METILDKTLDQPHQFHHQETLLFCLSRLFERASYFGLRAIIALYLMSDVFQMDRSEALDFYGLFAGFLLLGPVIGGLIGDLVIGNKRAMIVGGIMQALGALTLCIPSSLGLYAGLGLVIIGSGLYYPNIISNFGKSYLNKIKLLDAGFTAYYLAGIVGSFLGVAAISYAGEMLGWNIGFLIAGLLMVASTAFAYFTKKETKKKEKSIKAIPINQRVFNIVIVFILVVLFWAGYEIANGRVLGVQYDLRTVSTLEIPQGIWWTISTGVTVPVGIIAIIIWTRYYSSQLSKLSLGFLFAAIAYGLMFLIPEFPTEQYTLLFLVSSFLLGVAEIHIAPVIYSILTEFANPKYLAILASLAFLPGSLSTAIAGYYMVAGTDDPIQGLGIGLFTMTLISVALILFLLRNKKTRQVQ